MSAMLTIDKLSKQYPGTSEKALDKLTLTVNSGEVYGFLGANGAGKSTTIRLLLNFLQPTGGSAQILGLDIVRDSAAVKQHIGYLSGDVALYPKATGRELLDYLGELQHKPYRDYLKVLAKRFEAQLNKPIGELSKGNRQKIGLLQAMMHKPELLIFDEPTSGLDPIMQEVFYSTIRELKQEGAAVFMSSHNLGEAQGSCDRIGIIKRGKLIHEQSMEGDGELAKPVFAVTLATAEQAAKLAKTAGIKVIERQGTLVRVRAAKSINELLAVLSKYDVTNLTSTQLSLEDEFMEFYGKDA